MTIYSKSMVTEQLNCYHQCTTFGFLKVQIHNVILKIKFE